MSIAYFAGRVVRRIVSPVRKPRGQPVPCARSEPVAFRQSFPRVPPTFMTASEHADWLRREDAKVTPARFMTDTGATRDAWAGRADWVRVGLVCSRPEMSLEVAEQMRGAQQRRVSPQEERARRDAQGRGSSEWLTGGLGDWP